MKTLTQVLRDADPLEAEPRARERGARRQAIVDRLQATRTVEPRRRALVTLATLAVATIGLTSVYAWRNAVNVAAQVRFEAYLAEENPEPGLREIAIAGTNRTIYVHPESVVVNGDIVRARVVPGATASTFGVALTLSAEGGERLLRATQNHIDRPLAILIDGEVVAAPTVRSPITTAAIINGDFGRADAQRIADGILGR